MKNLIYSTLAVITILNADLKQDLYKSGYPAHYAKYSVFELIDQKIKININNKKNKIMKIIKKEFEREVVSNEIIIDTLTVTVEVDNKQHNIVIDNQSNFSQEKYQFSTSEYMNDDIDADILEQFENSDFYNELCEFAENEAIACDDEQESDIIDEINENFEIHKKDNNFYNNKHLTIFKNRQENSLVDFMLRVKRIVNNSLEQSFYEISASDFDQDEDEVYLKEFYDYDCNNQIHYSHQIN